MINKFPTNKIEENKNNDSEFGTHFVIIVKNYLAFSTWRHYFKSLEYANRIR